VTRGRRSAAEVKELRRVGRPTDQFDRRRAEACGGYGQFDPKNVGWVTEESTFGNGTFDSAPNNKNGNGNGGHVYGTDLSDNDRWALVEYLKTL
jgi:hypothetical protein